MAYSKAKISIPNVTGNIVITATAVPSAPAYTNLANPASAEWQDNKRINSSGNATDAAGHFICNKIPVTAGHVLRIKGVTTPQGTDNCGAFENGSSTRIALNSLSTVLTAGYCSYDAEKATLTWTAFIGANGSQSSTASNAVSFQGSFAYASGYTANDIIITVDEEIE